MNDSSVSQKNLSGDHTYLFPTNPFNLTEWIFYIFLTHGLYALFIVIGNAAVVYAFYKNPRLRSTTNLVLISMAIADLIIGLFVLPGWAYIQYNRYNVQRSKADDNFDEAWRNIDQSMGLISVYHLVYLHCLRCYSILFPLRHRRMSKKPVIITMLFIWAICAAFPPVVRDLTNKSCRYCFALITLFANVGIPVLFVAASNFFLWRRVAKSSRQHQRKDTKLLVTVVILIALLVICFLPFMVVNFYASLTGKAPSHAVVIVVKLFHYFNSGINPIVYALRNPDLGRAVRLIVCGDVPRQINTNQHTTGTAVTISNM